MDQRINADLDSPPETGWPIHPRRLDLCGFSSMIPYGAEPSQGGEAQAAIDDDRGEGNGIMRPNGIAFRLVSGPLGSSIRSVALGFCLWGVADLARADDPPAPASTPRPGLVDLGQSNGDWRGYHVPAGFRLDVVADAKWVGSPVTMTFDDSGRLYVAEAANSDSTFDVWESITTPDGAKVRLQQRRSRSLDQIRRLTDTDGDGQFDASEVVVAGVERPTALVWTKHALFVTALGRLERWQDDDGDGRYEARTILIDGLGAVDARGLTGLTLGADGYLYLSTGDNEKHAFHATGATIHLPRTGGLFRCRLDGSDLRLIASGFRQLRGNLAFDSGFQPILIDDDGADGSKLAGVRLIEPIEAGDYGWRTLADSAAPDHEVGAVDGERPGRLAPFARLGGSAPASLVLYNGTAFPEVCRGLALAADPARHAIRGFKWTRAAGLPTLVGETTLLGADDPRFTPEQVLVGPDSAVYILDTAGTDPPASPDRTGGRIIRLGWQTGPKAPLSQGDKLAALPSDQLIAQGLASADQVVAGQAFRELVDRGVANRPALLAWAGNPALPVPVRLLAIQGARRFWNEHVEGGMLHLLSDPQPDVRHLAAQSLAWEPRELLPRLVPKLLDRLEDPDGRVVRAVVMAIGRHGETNPTTAAPNLVRWLYAHPQADAPTRDAVLRGLERLGEAGVAEVALAVRTRRGTEREQAIRLFAALRSPFAAEELATLLKTPDLPNAERTTLIRQFADFPAEPPVSTTAMVDWVLKHSEVDPTIKLAALETCRLVGNPASALVLAMLDDDAESVRIAAMILAHRTRPPGAMLKVKEWVNDNSRSDLERLTAVQTLRGGNFSLFDVLETAYLGSDNAEIRRNALRSMADVDRPRSQDGLTSALAGPDPATRGEAIAILGETPAGAVDVGKSYLNRTLGRDDLPAVLRALGPARAREVKPVLAAVKRDATQGPTALAPSTLRGLVAQGGNPWAGMEVFYRASSRCASCHQVGGKGGRTGPPLDLEAHGLGFEGLVEAIQHPARSIKPGYEPAHLAMATDPEQGSSRSGPLAGLDRHAAGSDAARDAVMPDGLDLTWTPREFADLVAFLLDAPAQACIRQGGFTAVDHWAAAGPFAPGVDSLRVPLDRFEPNRPLAGQNGRTLGWLPLVASPSTGQIDLGGLFALQPSRAYAAAEVRSNVPQTAWLHVSTRGAARVYLNGAKVADRVDRTMTASLPSTTDVVRVTLKSGENLVVVAFDPPTGGEPLASLRLASPQPVEIRTPRLDSEGPRP